MNYSRMAYRIRMSQQIFRACSVSFPHIYPPKKMGSMCTCHLCFGGRNSFLLHTCSCSPVSSLENIHIIPDHTSQFVLSQLVWAISCVFDDGVLIRASLRVRYLPNPLVVRPRPLISFEGQKYRHISYSDTPTSPWHPSHSQAKERFQPSRNLWGHGGV